MTSIDARNVDKCGLSLIAVPGLLVAMLVSGCSSNASILTSKEAQSQSVLLRVDKNLPEVDVRPRLHQLNQRQAYDLNDKLADAASSSSWDVSLQFTIDEQGVPRDIRYVQTTNEKLADAAIEAVGAWRFLPAMKGGVAVAYPGGAWFSSTQRSAREYSASLPGY